MLPLPQPSDDAVASATDEQLVARFARGETAALAQLAARHEANLLGLATGLLQGRHERARDAVQEAWLRVIRHADRFEGRSSFRTWMYRIVINKCNDMRERDTRDKRDSSAHERESATELSPLRLVSDDALAQQVRAAMSLLPAHTRLLLILCYHQGLSHAQAADVLDIPVGTLKSRLAAALQELRGTMQLQGKKAVQP